MHFFCPWFPTPVLLFFFNDTATTEIYTLSLHDALPIYNVIKVGLQQVTLPSLYNCFADGAMRCTIDLKNVGDRKSTRLNSSHQIISYAVFCLKKKKTLVSCPL